METLWQGRRGNFQFDEQIKKIPRILQKTHDSLAQSTFIYAQNYTSLSSIMVRRPLPSGENRRRKMKF